MEMLQIPLDGFSLGFGKAAGYTKVGLKNKKYCILGRVCWIFWIFPYPAERGGDGRAYCRLSLRCVPQPRWVWQRCWGLDLGTGHHVPAQSPVTCVAWASELWLADWMNMGWVMSWPAGIVTCWIWYSCCRHTMG